MKEKPEHPDMSHVYINEELTKFRANLAHEARSLRNSGQINDAWTMYGKIMVKDKHNRICAYPRISQVQCTKGSLSIYKLENHNSCTLLFCITVCMITYNKYPMNKSHSCFISHYCVLCTCTNLMYFPVLLCTTKMTHCKNIFRHMPVNNHAADIYYHMSVIHHVQMLLTKDPTLPIWLRHTVLFVREKYYLIPRNFIVLAVVNIFTETVVGF